MNIWLAPLDGITNYIFRNSLCRHFAGIDYFITPFLPVQETAKLNVSNWKDIWPKNNMVCPTTPQLMGNKAPHFVDTMNLLHETYGYTSFNWNIGCPVAQVVRRKRGCGFMPDTDGVEEVVRMVTEQTDYKFSVKMRLGLHDTQESAAILNRLEKYPLEYIVLHPRLGEQMYNGIPDLKTLSELLAQTHHRIIYSGDLNFANESMAPQKNRYDGFTYEYLQTQFPQINDWMLGRGILRDPFLAERIKGMDTGDERNRFSKYYQQWISELLPLRKERGTLFVMKEMWHYYASRFNLSEEALRKMLRIDDFEKFYDESLKIITNA